MTRGADARHGRKIAIDFHMWVTHSAIAAVHMCHSPLWVGSIRSTCSAAELMDLPSCRKSLDTAEFGFRSVMVLRNVQEIQLRRREEINNFALLKDCLPATVRHCIISFLVFSNCIYPVFTWQKLDNYSRS